MTLVRSFSSKRRKAIELRLLSAKVADAAHVTGITTQTSYRRLLILHLVNERLEQTGAFQC